MTKEEESAQWDRLIERLAEDDRRGLELAKVWGPSTSRTWTVIPCTHPSQQTA